LGLGLYQKWTNLSNTTGSRIGYAPGTSTTFEIRNDGGGNIDLITTTSATPELSVTPTGVGINQPNPTAILHVDANFQPIKIDNLSISTGIQQYLTIDPLTGDINLQPGIAPQLGISFGQTLYWDGATNWQPTDFLTTLPGSGVGIDLPLPAAPLDKLHIADGSTSGNNYVRWTNSAAPTGARIGNQPFNNVFEIRQEEANDMQFWSNGTLVAHINDQFGAGTPFLGVGTPGPLGIGGALVVPGSTTNPQPVVFSAAGNGEFDGDLRISGAYYQVSDENLKESFLSLESDWKKILNISPYSYSFKPSDEFNFSKSKSYGFKAQEIKQHIPELVTYNGKFHLVNYNGFIPFLTQGIQEHEMRLEALEQNLAKEKDIEIESLKNENLELKNRITNIEEQLSKICNLPCFQSNLESNKSNPLNKGKLEDAPILEQNEPNPFNQTTIIRYYIPKYAQKTNILVKNTEGKIVGDYNIAEKGHGSIQVNSGLLSAGSFYYSLIIDGSLIDTKKMILLK
jgi:hypothetical protein